MFDIPNPIASYFDAGPLAQLFDAGGPVLLVLAAMAAIGLTAFFYLMLYGALFAPRLTRSVKHLMRVWQERPGPLEPVNIRPGGGAFERWNPLRALVAFTIDAHQRDLNPDQIRETLARDARRALAPFDAPLKIMEVIAALAPLLGLLGTVIGMIEAFGAMAAAEGRANASVLSGGIYKALFTTAAGLIVAIPFAALAAWAEFRLKRLHTMMNDTLVGLLGDAETADVPIARARTEKPDPSSDGASGGWQQPQGSEERFRYATG